MPRNARCTRNERTRQYLDELIKGCPPGSVLFTEEISIALSTRFRSVTNRNVGNAMRERDDVTLEQGGGAWRVK
jgi:hypothetical protein